MSVEKKYWQDLIERDDLVELAGGRENEFVEKLPVEEVLADKKFQDSSASRRDFLKFLGFSVTAATLAACETPVIKSIPYVNKPEEITPGEANWYASTYINGKDYCPVLVKTREGRHPKTALCKRGEQSRLPSPISQSCLTGCIARVPRRHTSLDA